MHELVSQHESSEIVDGMKEKQFFQSDSRCGGQTVWEMIARISTAPVQGSWQCRRVRPGTRTEDHMERGKEKGA